MFEDRLKKLREQRGLTQTEVAKQLGLSPKAYCNYERNLREPNSTVMIKIARFFNVSLDYLCGNNAITHATDNTPKLIVGGNDTDRNKKRITELFDKLSPVQQENIIARAELYAEQNEEALKQDSG